MKVKIKLIFVSAIFIICSGNYLIAQDSLWTLQKCISYARENNLDIQKAGLNNQQSQIYLEQAKSSRLPSVRASVNQNFGWNKSYDDNTGQYRSYSQSSNTSLNLNSSASLFNGMKISNQIKQSEIDLKSSLYQLESVKESIELDILNAYLQVLYSKESLVNARKQIESTREQLLLATEHLKLGLIAQSDYLQIKSELASENLTFTNAESSLILARINLMQIMELPVNDSFDIIHPQLENQINTKIKPLAEEVYNYAVMSKPTVKQAELNTKSADLNKVIAKAGYFPTLSLNAGLGTTFSGAESNIDFTSQINNRLSPSIGFSLSIPVFQKKQVTSDIKLARISYNEAELNEINVKNSLRKEIEQAVANVIIAQKQYDASIEELSLSEESMKIAEEKFKLGLLNAVDFLFEKTNFILAESQLLQSKYNLLFSYKVLDYYQGTPLNL
jgi:outer membrane protein